jgi:hypothetical protein
MVGTLSLRWYVSQPDIVFLRDDDAEWIVPDLPFELPAKLADESVAYFREFIIVGRVPETATLEYAALGEVAIYLAGQKLHSESGVEDWATERRFVIGEHLVPGRHELAFAVRNWNGPVALRVACPELKLATDPNWEANMGEGWTPARLASDRPFPAPALGVPSGKTALFSRLWVWLLAFALGAASVAGRAQLDPVASWIARPRNLQYILLGLWTALAFNNFWRLPLEGGFDAPHHVAYVDFILQVGALPLASDGWQMFQMPLLYLIAALPKWALGVVLGSEQVEYALRLLPLTCGVLHIPVARRTLAAAFPDREDLQSLGIVFVGLLPMNLYMSQWFGNEPFAGLMSAVVLMQLVEILRVPALGDRRRRQFLLAVSLAAAILAKVTAVLLIPATLLVLLHAQRGRPGILTAGRVLALLVLLAGWPFVRNLFELGSAFVFSSTSFEWWQDPGYRVPEDLLRFGRAIDRPVFASTSSFWNALYSTFWVDGQMGGFAAVSRFPPWNLNFVLAGGWLGLPLAVAMVAGGVLGLLRRDHVVLLALGCISLYMAALLQQYLALPIYSTSKATYTLGLLPLYAILLAGGLAPLLRGRPGRAIVTGFIAGWALFSYLGYFAT